MSQHPEEIDGWPERFRPFRPIKAVGRFIGSLLVPFHEAPDDYMSTHNRGAAVMLDDLLFTEDVSGSGVSSESLVE